MVCEQTFLTSSTCWQFLRSTAERDTPHGWLPTFLGFWGVETVSFACASVTLSKSRCIRATDSPTLTDLSVQTVRKTPLHHATQANRLDGVQYLQDCIDLLLEHEQTHALEYECIGRARVINENKYTNRSSQVFHTYSLRARTTRIM